jgi:hemerythrin-like domain-containing protein
MYKQPFIFLGPPYILKFLQDSGYKTFNNFWDESYDNITDHHSRMLAILELIENLSKLSGKEKLELSNHIQDIVEFNFNKFVTQTPTMLYDFIEKYGT